MKFLELELKGAGNRRPVAYYHAHWTRAGAPLLDLLGAVIDHLEPHSAGGPDHLENLATACNKCNGRKSAAALDEYLKRPKEKQIRGKYGEPLTWDGFSSLFMMLTQRHPAAVTAGEKDWLRALAIEPG